MQLSIIEFVINHHGILKFYNFAVVKNSNLQL